MTESAKTVLLLRSGPSTPEAEGALYLAASRGSGGHAVALVLIQDAVLAAISHSQVEGARQLRGLIAAGAECRYLTEDLAMRGYGLQDVSPGCQACSDDDLVDVLLADGTRVIGAF